MTTSRQPWTIESTIHSQKTWVKDADGTVIGVFDNWQDAELLMQWQGQAEALDEAQEKLQEIEQVLKGEY